jgi:uncharacterized protein YndB with AHSA1/START domain
MSRAVVTVEPARQDVVLTREFGAPRELVFRTYTDPAAIPPLVGPAAPHDQRGPHGRAAGRRLAVRPA